MVGDVPTYDYFLLMSRYLIKNSISSRENKVNHRADQLIKEK